MTTLRRPWLWLVVGVGVLLVAAGMAWTAYAADDAPTAAPAGGGSPMHPPVILRDADGKPVVETGNPVSTIKTCGACHDADYIASHSYHADVGLSAWAPGQQPEPAHSWDASPGLFGRWNPLLYRYLTPAQGQPLDLGTPEWLMRFGARHIGGGPAVLSRDGQPLTALTPDPDNPETAVLGPDGQPQAWDWAASGTVEMNCFLCHLPNPDNEARLAALAAGQFAWANTATLDATGLVHITDQGYAWNTDMFLRDGSVPREVLAIQDPTSQNCALCHGVVQARGDNEPLVIRPGDLQQWETATTGQIFAADRISESGMNIRGKSDLQRAWDVHAERDVQCNDCHHALNNPAYKEEWEDRPPYLTYDPRRVEIGDYLLRPNHDFARGHSSQVWVDPDSQGTVRACSDCHDARASHEDWLPYTERHMMELACESCHVPQIHAPALAQVDWTVVLPNGQPRRILRGIQGGTDPVHNEIVGFEPVALLKTTPDGTQKWAPYNLVGVWYWIYDDPPKPVPQHLLRAAYLDGDAYRDDVLAVFDANGDGQLQGDELRLDSDAKVQRIAQNLEALGLAQPRVSGEVMAFNINHSIADHNWAVRDCQACHSESSRLAAPMQVAWYVPAGVDEPSLAYNAHVAFPGTWERTEAGLFFRPQPREAGYYLFGHSAYPWIDWLGALMTLGSLLGVVVHGGLRLVAHLKLAQEAQAHGQVRLHREYMYGFYERLWHWVQAVVIILLIFTGLVVHRPETFGGWLDFPLAVRVHNILAIILVLNAALALFYHLASGEIRQFVPQPRGFFNQAIEQAKYYLGGIFRGEPHPFEKSPRRKLNPLQQITYFGLLNVLLPLQILTGLVMFGAQLRPDLADKLGGLRFLAPLHTLTAWAFAAFVIMHIYLTTTGPTPTAYIKAMITGWEEVEEHGTSSPTVASADTPEAEA